MPNVQAYYYIWGAIGAIIGAPIALYTAYMTTSRWKFLGMLSGLSGVVIGYLLVFFFWGTVLNTTKTLDNLTVFAVCLLFCPVTGVIGALLFNFLFNGSPPQSRNSQVEY
jgi:hypothetical protein